MSSSQGSKKFSTQYFEAFRKWAASGNDNLPSLKAAMSEGDGPSGGYAVPSIVDGNIVPTVPPDSAVRKLSTVLPTSSDIFLPVATAPTAAALKPESGKTVSMFAKSDPTLGRVRLSAFMAGGQVDLSLELALDIPLFGSWVTAEMTSAQQTVEEALYVSGTGVNEAQGLLGNVGAGITAEPDSYGPVAISSLFDLLGTLKDEFHQGASFLMSRTTSTAIRRSAIAQNISEPLFTRSGSQEYLLGYPVQHSAAMPSAVRSACPILFGDFKAGYIIGDRGGSELRVKLLDQANLLAGYVSFFGFRRTDGRVRRPDAIQSLNISAS